VTAIESEKFPEHSLYTNTNIYSKVFLMKTRITKLRYTIFFFAPNQMSVLY